MKTRSHDDFFKGDREYGPNRSRHGGELARGKRKVNRPFRKYEPHHLSLKSSHAKNGMSMLGPRFKLKIDQLIEAYAEKFKIKLHSKQNVGNHIHLVVGAPRKEFLQDFLRTICGVIARLVTGAKKGKPFGKKNLGSLGFFACDSWTARLQGDASLRPQK